MELARTSRIYGVGDTVFFVPLFVLPLKLGTLGFLYLLLGDLDVPPTAYDCVSDWS